MSTRLFVILAAYLAICVGLYLGVPRTPAEEVASSAAVSQAPAAPAQTVTEEAPAAPVEETTAVDDMEVVATSGTSESVTSTRNISPTDRISLLEVWTAIEECRVARCQALNLGEYSLSFIPDEIRDLERLNTVIAGDAVSDISALRNMAGLRIINLSGSKVNSVEPLAANPGIRVVEVANTPVSDLLGISSLTTLEHLDVSGTQVTDLSPIAQNRALQFLDASNTSIFAVDALQRLFELSELNLSGSNILDVSVLSELGALKSVDLSNTQLASLPDLSRSSGLETLNLSGTQIGDLAAIRQATSLQNLDLSDTPVRDISRLANLRNIKTLDLTGTQVTTFTALLGLPSLETVKLPAVAGSDTVIAALQQRNVSVEQSGSVVAAAPSNSSSSSSTEVIENTGGGVTGDIKILTGNQYAPYVDDDLPEGGFSTELIDLAFKRTEGVEHSFTVVPDWGQHFRPLLAEGEFDLGYPWYQPDCSRREFLSERSVWRCDMLRFSRPMHEILISAYALNDVAASIETPEDAKGLRICRPEGYFTFDLEAFGLVEDTYERLMPKTPAECFEGLRNGTVDIATINASTGEDNLTKLDLTDIVSEVFPLSSVQTLHLVGMKSSERARLLLRRFDIGLLALRRDGTFQDLAAKHGG